MVDREYPLSQVRTDIERAFHIDSTVRHRPKPAVSRPRFIVPYHPGLPDISRFLREVHHIMAEDDRLRQMFPAPPTLVFTQPKSLRQHLVRAKNF